MVRSRNRLLRGRQEAFRCQDVRIDISASHDCIECKNNPEHTLTRHVSSHVLPEYCHGCECVLYSIRSHCFPASRQDNRPGSRSEPQQSERVFVSAPRSDTMVVGPPNGLESDVVRSVAIDSPFGASEVGSTCFPKSSTAPHLKQRCPILHGYAFVLQDAWGSEVHGHHCDWDFGDGRRGTKPTDYDAKHPNGERGGTV